MPFTMVPPPTTPAAVIPYDLLPSPVIGALVRLKLYSVYAVPARPGTVTPGWPRSSGPNSTTSTDTVQSALINASFLLEVIITICIFSEAICNRQPARTAPHNDEIVFILQAHIPADNLRMLTQAGVSAQTKKGKHE